MPKLAANLMCMFTELPFFERFEAAQRAGFRYISINSLMIKMPLKSETHWPGRDCR